MEDLIHQIGLRIAGSIELSQLTITIDAMVRNFNNYVTALAIIYIPSLGNERTYARRIIFGNALYSSQEKFCNRTIVKVKYRCAFCFF